MSARDLIKECLDLPAILDRLTDEADLVAAGVNSGEIVRIALRCEEYLDRALTDYELAGLTSVRAVADLISPKAVR